MLAVVLAAALAQSRGVYVQGPGGRGYVDRISCGSGLTCTVADRYAVLSCSGGPGGGAPTDVQYWTGAAHADLSAEKNLGALDAGLVINTAGAPSIYAGSSCGANQWATATSSSGALTCSQPGFSNISGSVTDAQVPNNITVDLATAATTAAALASDPSDCGAGFYAHTIAANGNLTCGQVGFSQLSGTATDAQIPNDITVTLASTATALAADPADCAANRYATTINASGALTCAQVDLTAGVTGTLPAANGGATQMLRVVTNNVTNSTTNAATITGLSWNAAAATEYGFYCVITATGTATSLPRFSISGPASPTAVSFVTQRFTTTSAQTLLVLQAFSSTPQTAACASSCNATQLPTIISGTILNGSNAGAVAIQVTSSTSGQTVTVHRGSYCRVY